MPTLCELTGCGVQSSHSGKGKLCRKHLESNKAFLTQLAPTMKLLNETTKPLWKKEKTPDTINDDNAFELYSSLPHGKHNAVCKATAIACGLLDKKKDDAQRKNKQNHYHNEKENEPEKYHQKLTRNKEWKQKNDYDRSTEHLEVRMDPARNAVEKEKKKEYLQRPEIRKKEQKRMFDNNKKRAEVKIAQDKADAEAHGNDEAVPEKEAKDAVAKAIRTVERIMEERGFVPILYTAKAHTSSIVKEIQSPFTSNRIEHILVEKDGGRLKKTTIKKIVAGVKPEHRHLIYQSTNEANAKEVEKRIHDAMGLKWGYLYQKIGAGGMSTAEARSRKKLYVVYIYEYHVVYDLLKEKKIKWNPACELAFRTDGPGPPPVGLDQALEYLDNQMQIVISKFPVLRIYE